MFACDLPLLLLYNALDIYASHVRNMGLVCCGFVLFKLQLLCCGFVLFCGFRLLYGLLCLVTYIYIYILENLMCSLWNFYGTHNNIYIYIYIFIKFLWYTQ